MTQLPDAPWIRDAMINGMDDGPDVTPVCPVCGAEEPDDFYVMDGEVIGCSECVSCKDAYEWTIDHMEEDDHD